MGSSSKVILVGATSLIVGVYAISLKKAETSGYAAAMKQVKRVQNERMEDAAIRTALHEFVAEQGKNDKSGSKKAFGGGEYTYTIKQHGTYADVVVTITRDGVMKTITARLEKKLMGVQQGPRKIHRGDWQIAKIYTER